MKMVAKETQSENIKKTSMGRWMRQVRRFGARHLGNTNHRGPMPFVAARFPCAWRHPARNAG